MVVNAREKSKGALSYTGGPQTTIVVPAKAGIHNTVSLEAAYGFPPSRE